MRWTEVLGGADFRVSFHHVHKGATDLSSVSRLKEANWWSNRWSEFMQSQSLANSLERLLINNSQSQGKGRADSLPYISLSQSIAHLRASRTMQRTMYTNHQCALPRGRDEKKCSASSWNPSPIHRALEQKLKWETELSHSLFTGLTAAAQRTECINMSIQKQAI